MRFINNMQWSSNSDPLFKKNKILKLEDLVKLELQNYCLIFTDVNYRILSLSISKRYLKFIPV